MRTSDVSALASAKWGRQFRQGLCLSANPSSRSRVSTNQGHRSLCAIRDLVNDQRDLIDCRIGQRLSSFHRSSLQQPGSFLQDHSIVPQPDRIETRFWKSAIPDSLSQSDHIERSWLGGQLTRRHSKNQCSGVFLNDLKHDVSGYSAFRRLGKDAELVHLIWVRWIADWCNHTDEIDQGHTVRWPARIDDILADN
jgi:hypothetical protein